MGGGAELAASGAIDFGAIVGCLLGGLSLFLYGMEKMSDGAPRSLRIRGDTRSLLLASV